MQQDNNPKHISKFTTKQEQQVLQFHSDNSEDISRSDRK